MSARKKGPTGGYEDEPRVPRRDHRISLEKAIDLTQRFRRAAPPAEHGGLFDAGQVRDLLSQKGCVGLRYYHGIEADGTYHLVIVGVDARGEDIIPSQPKRGRREKVSLPTRQALVAAEARLATTSLAASGGIILENHWSCPPICARESPLS
jgi:hypothetical protein